MQDAITSMNCHRHWSMNGVRFLSEGVKDQYEACPTEYGQLHRPEEDTQNIDFCDIPILKLLYFDKYFEINLEYFNLLNFLLTVVFRKEKYLGMTWNIAVNFTVKRKVWIFFVDGYLFNGGCVHVSSYETYKISERMWHCIVTCENQEEIPCFRFFLEFNLHQKF